MAAIQQRSPFQASLQASLALLVLTGASARASEATPPQMYELTTETGMPHLEENLRYTITHRRRCLARQELFGAFPVLHHSALKGCRLEGETRQDDFVSYQLVCKGRQGATGKART
jgi:hypothetical protein